jgi:hypothetical protein
VLTPLREDPPSALPVVVALSRALVSPAAAENVAGEAVNRYGITPEIINRLRG